MAGDPRLPASAQSTTIARIMALARLAFATLVIVLAATTPASYARAENSAQNPTAPTDEQLFKTFQSWLEKQSAPVTDLEADYRKVLAAEGLPAAEVDRRLRVIIEQLQKSEKERWNRILTAPSPRFNTKPNAFLVEVTRRLTPGKALDVGMGQGRNALYLAQQGWAVTGFDPADQAVAAAEAEAKRIGVTLKALVLREDQFDFGTGQWDLIVLSYVGARGFEQRVYDSLKPGGSVVVEAFHRDATKATPIGGAVVFDTNELVKLFERFRILRYEDVEGVGDFGLERTRLVRLHAQKP
jgi:SAM-dependent methyltransferase